MRNELPHDGGPAFARPSSERVSASNCVPAQPGMSLRMWLAAQAMNGLLSSLGPDEPFEIDDITAEAFGLADAMIAADSGR